MFEYSVLCVGAMFIQWFLITDMAVFSNDLSAFMVVVKHVLAEIGRFLVALGFLLLTFGSAISVLDHDQEEMQTIWDSAIALFAMGVPESSHCSVTRDAKLQKFEHEFSECSPEVEAKDTSEKCEEFQAATQAEAKEEKPQTHSPETDTPVKFCVLMVSGEVFDVELSVTAKVADMRNAVAGKHKIPPNCNLRLMQQAKVLIDSMLVSQLETVSPVFAAIVQGSALDAGLEAAASHHGYEELLSKPGKLVEAWKDT